MTERDFSRTTNTASVLPDDRLYEELGNNTYTINDIFSELIDNSLAARDEGKILNVTIELTRDERGKPVRFKITDDAAGIPADILGKAIAPAGMHSSGSLNEHGLGMKQSIAALGKLEYLLTKTAGESKARAVKEFKFGDLPIFETEFEQDSGTEIAVREIKADIKMEGNSIATKVIPYLGARYRRYLTDENPKMNLKLVMLNEHDDSPRDVKVVTAFKPIYFNPTTRENRPVIDNFVIEGRDWKARLTFGYAPQSDSEYEELGLSPVPAYHPYNVSLAKQGLDILIYDRVIQFHKLHELGIVPSQHNRFNGVRGELNMEYGFSTAITKNSFIADENFIEMIDKVKDILVGNKPGPRNRKNDYLNFRSSPDQLPENLLRDRLATWFRTSIIAKRETVDTEYVIEGIEGYIDVLADNEAWELKLEQAKALDVYQLFMYMDVGEIDRGNLVAKGFSTGAQVAVRRIEEKHGKKINLITYDELPITDPPSQQELASYF